MGLECWQFQFWNKWNSCGFVCMQLTNMRRAYDTRRICMLNLTKLSHQIFFWWAVARHLLAIQLAFAAHFSAIFDTKTEIILNLEFRTRWRTHIHLFMYSRERVCVWVRCNRDDDGLKMKCWSLCVNVISRMWLIYCTFLRCIERMPSVCDTLARQQQQQRTTD